MIIIVIIIIVIYIVKDKNVASYNCCSYERSCRCRSTPERRLHPADSSPSSVTCPPPPPPATAAAASSDESPLTSSSAQEPPLYGSAALLHRGIYASVRIRASREMRDSRPAAGPTTPEILTVLPGCKCAGCDDERRTLPCRRRCYGDDCVHDAVVDTRSRNAPPFCSAGVPRDGAGVPCDCGCVPHNGDRVHRDAAGVPRDGAGVPHDGAAMPRDCSCVPRDGALVPRDCGCVPHGGAGVPCDAAGVPRDAVGNARTRSLLVVARPGLNNACPECHTVSLVSNAAGHNTEQHRNYGTATTTA